VERGPAHARRGAGQVRPGVNVVIFKVILPKTYARIGWKMLIYFLAIWNILLTFGIFYDHLVHFMCIWYIFSGFGITYQEKSGNIAFSRIATIFPPKTGHNHQK
jgi:hypothetical protein